MDVPSSSNVTGRRKRPAIQDDDDDDDSISRSTPMRKVRGNKRINPLDVAPNSVMSVVNNHVDEIVNKKKVGTLNCFDFKSPLELYGIEQMIEAKASIQEMAVVLEGAQHVIGYRVDRLHHDVRQVDAALSSGTVTRGTDGADDVQLSVESRRAKKKMAVADGMSGMTDYLNQMEEEYDMHMDDGVEDDSDGEPRRPAEEPAEVTIAGEPTIDPKANSKDVDKFMDKDMVIEDLINELVITRSNLYRTALTADVSSHVSSEDTAHDIKDASIDWLRANPTFQKATKGSLHNTANSFHSLNYYGMHSPSGRSLILHPRVIDKDAADTFFPSDVSVSLAKNTRALLENSLDKKPHVLDNYLMLEVKDRPVIGRYKIMSKEVKKSILPLAEASREKDLANLTFAEVNLRPTNADATMVGASDMSMLPVNQALPLAVGENDETIVLDRMTPNLNQTNSVGNQKLSNSEYIPPSIDQLNIDEALVGKLPNEPIDMDKLTRIFGQKLEASKLSDALEAKVWKNGMRAEEWGEDDDEIMKCDIRHTVQSGIEGWMKATDVWTNYDVVKMIVNREAKMQLDESVADEQDSYRSLVPEIGKNYFLVKSEDFMNYYPSDRLQDAGMIGEEMDVMKVWSGEENADDVPLEQIQQEIREQNIQRDLEVEPVDDIDYQAAGGGFDIDFDDRLGAPVEFDDIEPVLNRDNDEHVADILFNDQMDETEEELRDERHVQRDIENVALGADEVAELMTAAPPVQLVGPSAEMREEIRNIGKNDNAHWVPPEIADQERQTVAVAQRKRREKKAKSRKATVEDFVHYFRDLTEDDLEHGIKDFKAGFITDEKSMFLSEHQLYLPTLGVENKPHVAFEMGLLSNSGLFYKKTYGKIKLERIKQHKAEQELFIDETKGNKDSDCLNWLATFSGFRCMESLDTVGEDGEVQDQTAHDQPFDDYVNEYYDDDRYDPRYDQELAAAQMGPDMQKKFALATSQINQMMPAFHFGRDDGEYADSGDEFDDSFDRQAVQAKNLDAAKHKKCLAEILKNDTLSMPSIQFALEQLSLNQTLRPNNTTVRAGPNTSDRNRTDTSPTTSFEADKTLTSVFNYHSPRKSSHNVNEIMKALTEVPDYREEEETEPVNDNEPTSSNYGTANTENRKVKISGTHTLLSLALSMPSKMGETVRPSSIVSFLLHIANENGLQIVQDRSKRTWMSDFIVLNRSEALPRGLTMGKLEDLGEFWKKTQDPDAIEGGETGGNTVFGSLMNNRPKATPVRRARGAPQPPQAPDLEAIVEEDDME